ncbi:MAG: hypothetical protein QF570_17195 [Myxococcota bacterium]|nr:hypothetical protein [Myxococcota bacterium]
MFRPRTGRKRDLAAASKRFALYVEGPRDRDVLRAFAQRLSPELARAMDPCIRILGGRKPDRAAELFGKLVDQATEYVSPRALCVLDRDDPTRLRDAYPERERLEFVVWRRRQIESYLLVPGAIRRCIPNRRDHAKIDRVIELQLPACDNEPAFRDLDAKRVLGARGPIADVLGRPLRPREIVRNMSPLDIHHDVKEVLTRVRDHIEVPARN